MRRRRWARAAALCLAIAVALQLAVHGAGAAASGTTFSRRSRGGTPPKGLPPAAPASWTSLPAHHASLPRARGGAARGAAVALDPTAAAGARCKNSTAGKSAAVVLRAAACADEDDDKRVVPTGPNPLHNR